MTIANNAAVNTDVEDMVIVPVRESVAVEIHNLLDVIGKSYIEVGRLLSEAREDFEDAKSFLVWAEAEFAIKKAQCYNLMNVARVFGSDTRFEGAPMRAMLALIPMADDADVMDKAAALCDAGTLTLPAVNELLGKPKNTVVSLVNPDTKLVGDDCTEDKGEAFMDEANDSGQPSDWGKTTTPVAPDVSGVEATHNPTSSIQDATTQSLLDQNKRLSEQLAEAMNQIAALTSTRETKKATAPMLPQFKSKCLYARLGLSAEQSTSKSAISKARRELVKIGYGEGHEAWKAISEAVEKLTENAASTESEE